MGRLRDRLKNQLGLVTWQGKLRAVSMLLVVLLLAAIGVDVARMVNGIQDSVAVASEVGIGANVVSGLQGTEKMLAEIQKRRLFMPAIPLPVRSMARESVSRVKGMLSLHGIMKLNGERVAYINVEGMGMKAYKVGDQTEELFKVTRIEDQVIEVEIAGERVELGL